MRNHLVILLLLALSGLLQGCAQTSGTAYTPKGPAQRDPLTAQRLTLEAADLLITKPAKAEEMLRQALAADLFHGPAHNNLGVLYLEQGRLYESAGEFEWARKLMPGHPDPRMNLALVLEKAGRTEESLVTYAAALEVYPDYIPAVQALTRLQIRAGKEDERTAGRLSDIALRGESDAWRQWARKQLLELDGSTQR